MYLHVGSVLMHVTWAVCISVWDVHVFVGMAVHCVHVHVCVLHMYAFISAMYSRFCVCNVHVFVSMCAVHVHACMGHLCIWGARKKLYAEVLKRRASLAGT